VDYEAIEAIQPFLAEDRFAAAESILRSISTSASAITLMRPHIWRSIISLLVGTTLHLATHQRVRKYNKGIAFLLLPCLGCEIPEEYRVLPKLILTKAQGCGKSSLHSTILLSLANTSHSICKHLVFADVSSCRQAPEIWSEEEAYLHTGEYV
jgi:hypothetical protein